MDKDKDEDKARRADIIEIQSTTDIQNSSGIVTKNLGMQSTAET